MKFQVKYVDIVMRVDGFDRRRVAVKKISLEQIV